MLKPLTPFVYPDFTQEFVPLPSGAITLRRHHSVQYLAVEHDRRLAAVARLPAMLVSGSASASEIGIRLDTAVA